MKMIRVSWSKVEDRDFWEGVIWDSYLTSTRWFGKQVLKFTIERKIKTEGNGWKYVYYLTPWDIEIGLSEGSHNRSVNHKSELGAWDFENLSEAKAFAERIEATPEEITGGYCAVKGLGIWREEPDNAVYCGYTHDELAQAFKVFAEWDVNEHDCCPEEIKASGFTADIVPNMYSVTSAATYYFTGFRVSVDIEYGGNQNLNAPSFIRITKEERSTEMKTK